MEIKPGTDEPPDGGIASPAPHPQTHCWCPGCLVTEVAALVALAAVVFALGADFALPAAAAAVVVTVH